MPSQPTVSALEWLKFWPVAVFIGSIISTWAVFGTQLMEVKGRQDRQGTAFAALQTQVTGLANDVSGMKSDIGSIKDNVSYIRNRIDRVTQ